ncbi:MAG: phage portal protein, partial [Atribacterota bacterium]
MQEKKWSFSNLFKRQEKAVPKVGRVTNETREGISKSYIPDFLYKPPFGYPRYSDLGNVRRLASSPFVDMCITTVVDEISAVPYDIVPEDEEDEISSQKEREIQQVENFFYNPNTNKENFEIITKKLVRDILEVDAGVLEKIFNRKKEMVEIIARDGATFTKNPDIHGMFTNREEFILEDYIAYEDELKKQGFTTPSTESNWITAQDARNKASYFQYGWVTGARPIPFGKREIVWFERNPRTDTLYGRSPVEVLEETIQTLIYSIEHNLEYFSDNSIPKGIIGLEGADSEEIREFADNWKEQQRTKTENGSWRKKFHHVPIIGGKQPTFTKIQFSASELQLLEQQRWFSKIVWACYDDKTEILTENGWKLFKDLDDEKVARVNPNNLDIDYVKPIDKQEYNFNGELIKYNTKSCDLAVTPEHKMLQCNDTVFYNGNFKWAEKEAKDFERGIIPQAGKLKGKKIEKLNFKSEEKRCSRCSETMKYEIDGDNFCKFMGIWLSDGWVESSNNRIVLCVSDVYPKNKEFIENLLKDMGVDYKIKTSKVNGII